MKAYYNEIDGFCCNWLSNLMDAGHITPGKIDDRSIENVSPEDLQGYERAHFFAGIAGWELALNWAGWSGPSLDWIHVRVSRFRAQESDKDMPINDTCGPLFTASSPSASLQRSLESRLQARMEGNGSPLYVLTWSEVDMPAGVPILQLRASGRRTLDNASSGWLTPIATEARRDNATWAPSTTGNGMADNECARRHATKPAARTLGGFHGNAIASHGKGGVADANGGRFWKDEGISRQENQGRTSERPANNVATGGMGDANVQGSQGWCQHNGKYASQQPSWSASVAIPCADGKARPTQPGIHPLANGIPGRVGKLRAYGNAIVPQVAAAFVQAFNQLDHLGP